MSNGKGTIKERLVCLETYLKESKKSTDEKIDACKTNLDNHLRHHWEFNMVLLSAIAIEAIAFLILVLTKVFSS